MKRDLYWWELEMLEMVWAWHRSKLMSLLMSWTKLARSQHSPALACTNVSNRCLIHLLPTRSAVRRVHTAHVYSSMTWSKPISIFLFVCLFGTDAAQASAAASHLSSMFVFLLFKLLHLQVFLWEFGVFGWLQLDWQITWPVIPHLAQSLNVWFPVFRSS